LVEVELLTIGKELLIGKTVNTNAHWIGGRVAKLGTMLRRVTTIDDDLGEISSALHEILSRSPDFVVSVGGLGPTPDDMTLKGLARGLGRDLAVNREALSQVKGHYGPSVKMTKARRKMAVLPAGSEPLANGVGTAPGVRIEEGRTVIFALPGVPREMKSIFRASVEGELRKKAGEMGTWLVVLNLQGVFESSLAPIIAGAKRRAPRAYIKSHPKGREEGVSRVELDVTAVSKTKTVAKEEARSVAAWMVPRIVKAGGRIASSRGLE
jgi:molybdenum cofactor synthesis domain-containing protein